MPKRKPAGFSIIRVQQKMIEDKLRTLSYKKAIEDNLKKSDIVLDIGCGTGILSFFAAKKGCRKVYAIDEADVIDSAKETARLNGLDKNIEFIKGDILSFRPKEKLDVLILDQIGFFIWDENILSQLKYIRENFLNQGGRIIPFRIDLCLAPASCESDLEKSISFWQKKRYRIDFSNLSAEAFIQEAPKGLRPLRIELKNTKTFLCKEKLAYTLDLRKESKIPRRIAVSFGLKKNSVLRGICGYFNIHLDEKHVISTKPKKTNTHWGQFFLPYFGKKALRRNSTLNFTLFPKKKPEKWKFKFEIT